ncbi:hypothetical protein PV646_18090 [Streptomyces sp. ID05-26A]|nr:hypothetical protein [Streptomyces sp. ID05-26A]
MRARVVVQVVAVLAGAAFTFLAGWKYSDASSAWQLAIRVEVEKAGVHQDEVRRVYANEGPLAFRVAVLEIRADALAPLGDKARTERTIAENAAFAFRQASGPTTLLGQERYTLPGGGSDLVHRLADAGRERAKPLPDPEVPDREGDGAARLAWWISVITVLVTGLAVFWASVRGREPPLQLLPQPGSAPRPERRLTFLLLAIWTAGVLFPLTQLYFSSQEQRYQADSARHAVQARSAESISSTRTEFGVTALQIAGEGGVAATAREIGAVYSDAQTAATAGELTRAEERAAIRSEAVAGAMARPPEQRDGVEPGLAGALTSEPHDWAVMKALSDWEANNGDTFGTLSNTMLGLIGLVVLAEARFEVVAERRRQAQAAPPADPLGRGRRWDRRTAGLLCLLLVVAAGVWLTQRTTDREWRATPARAPGRRPGT